MTSAPGTEPNRSPLRALTSAIPQMGLVGVIVFLFVALSIYGHYDAAPGKPNTFLNATNLVEGIATPMSYYAIMAAGMTMVIVTGGIDISVASTMALAGFVTAYVVQSLTPGTSPYVVGFVSLAVPVAVGILCGAFNGLVITLLDLHPFIVTLGTLSIYRGIVNVLPFGTKTLPKGGAKLPEGSLTHLFRTEITFNGSVIRVMPMVAMLAVIAWAALYLRYTRAGRHIYAIGSNEQAARLCGVPVRWVKLRIYTICGLLAGLAGLVSLGKFGTTSAGSATGYELSVVAACVVGGASLSGGRGSAVGALLGTLVLALIENAINILHWDQEYKKIIVGLAIITAVAIDRLGDVFRQRRRG
ncbi:MAG: ABC transporter permease [Tepidisphaeraceae bacterium]